MTDFHIHRHEDVPESHLAETSVFRSDTYSMIYLEEGEAVYKIGLSDYYMKPGAFYFMGAYHLRYYRKVSKWKGYVVLFSEAFANRKGFVDIPKEFPFYQINANALLKPDEGEQHTIKQLMHQMHHFYCNSVSQKEDILFHLLNVSLAFAKGLYQQSHGNEEEKNLSKPARLAQSFERQLEEHFYEVAQNKVTRVFTVGDFADHLHITPNHLSEVVKNYFGKTPTQLIRERLIMEAKALLRSTDLSVSEVAYFLHFQDASNFAKFFKSYTEKSPSVYKMTS